MICTKCGHDFGEVWYLSVVCPVCKQSYNEYAEHNQYVSSRHPRYPDEHIRRRHTELPSTRLWRDIRRPLFLFGFLVLAGSLVYFFRGY